MACTYSSPCTFSNPNNNVTVIGQTSEPVWVIPLKAPTHWNWTTCTSTNPGWTNAGANCTPQLQSKLNQWLLNTNHLSYHYGGYNMASWVGHLGAYTPGKPNCSYHRTGDAIDLAWMQWVSGVDCRPCNMQYEATAYGHRRKRLVAMEAGLRKQFGYVLNRGIPDHHQHFHVDSGCATGMHISWGSTARQYRSTAYFIQDCINSLTNITVAYDGIWGNQTETYFNALKAAMGMDCLNPKVYLSHYYIFLDYIQMHGFADKQAGYYRWSGCP